MVNRLGIKKIEDGVYDFTVIRDTDVPTPKPPEPELVNPFKGTVWGVLGDSISTFEGYSESESPSGEVVNGAYYPYGDVTKVGQMYWERVKTKLKLKSVAVSAISRSRFYNDNNPAIPVVYEDWRIERLSMNGVPDYVVVNVGTNDPYQSNIGDVQVTHELGQLLNWNTSVSGAEITIRKIQEKYPSARIIWCIPKLPYTGDSSYSFSRFEDLCEKIKVVAGMLGVWKVIDLRGCGVNYSNMEQTCIDGGMHPNSKGMKMLSDYICWQLVGR